MFRGLARMVLILPILAGAALCQSVATLQPGPGLNDGSDDGSPSLGMDASVTQPCGARQTPRQNFGSRPANVVLSSHCNDCTAHSFLRFHLASLPQSHIRRVRLRLRTFVWQGGCGWAFSADPVFSLRRVAAPWREDTICWADQPPVDPTLLATATFSGIAGLMNFTLERTLDYDITPLYLDWLAGRVPNYGLRVSQENILCPNCTSTWFVSSDDPRPDLRPLLEVTWDPPPPPFPLRATLLSAAGILMFAAGAWLVRHALFSKR